MRLPYDEIKRPPSGNKIIGTPQTNRFVSHCGTDCSPKAVPGNSTKKLILNTQLSGGHDLHYVLKQRSLLF